MILHRNGFYQVSAPPPSPPKPKPNVLENSKPVNLKNLKFKFIRYDVSKTNGIIAWNRIVVFDFLYM